MKIYKISQEICSGYDTYSDAVVIAKDWESAAKIYPGGDYFKNDSETDLFVWNGENKGMEIDDWCRSWKDVKVEYIGEADDSFTEETIVCASYHAG